MISTSPLSLAPIVSHSNGLQISSQLPFSVQIICVYEKVLSSPYFHSYSPFLNPYFNSLNEKMKMIKIWFNAPSWAITSYFYSLANYPLWWLVYEKVFSSPYFHSYSPFLNPYFNSLNEKMKMIKIWLNASFMSHC